MESWQKVVGWPEYEVSSLGRVRRTGTGTVRKTQINRGGYEQVHLSRGGRARVFRVHTLVLEAFVQLRPTGQEADHLDGNRANNILPNLRWQMRYANRAHIGSAHGNAKVTERDIRMIRKLYAAGRYTQEGLAVQYNLHQTNVSLIVRGLAWRHV